jgi:EAL domain-containing protein (putative c-di-GMP-specific phosphodiesterase class I)
MAATEGRMDPAHLHEGRRVSDVFAGPTGREDQRLLRNAGSTIGALRTAAVEETRLKQEIKINLHAVQLRQNRLLDEQKDMRERYDLANAELESERAEHLACRSRFEEGRKNLEDR